MLLAKMVVSSLQRQQVSPGAEPKVVVTCVGDGISLTFSVVEGGHPDIGERLVIDLTVDVASPAERLVASILT